MRISISQGKSASIKVGSKRKKYTMEICKSHNVINKEILVSHYISKVILNVNGLKSPIKRSKWLDEFRGQKDPRVSAFIPAPQVITEHRAEYLMLYSFFLLAILNMVCTYHVTLSILPTFSFLHYVHKSILYIYNSISALQIGLLVTFFQIPYIH